MQSTVHILSHQQSIREVNDRDGKSPTTRRRERFSARKDECGQFSSGDKERETMRGHLADACVFEIYVSAANTVKQTVSSVRTPITMHHGPS